MFYDTGPKAHSYKKCRATLKITLHFAMIGIKVKNNFTLHFMLCKKSVHEMVFILLSFSE
jgi:hypothetical protein